MIPQLKVLLMVALFMCFPGIIMAVRRRGLSPDSIILGMGSGLAVGVVVGWYCSWLGNLSWALYIMWSFPVAAIILSWKTCPVSDPCLAVTRREWYWLGGSAVLVFLFIGIPVFSSCWPLGWDASFHSLLAKKIVLTRQLSTDWLPFEPVPVNYPQGLHAFVALTAEMAGTAPHEALQTSHLVFMFITALTIFSLARAAFGNFAVGIMAMLTVSLLAENGAFFRYYQWGGSPTELSMLFFLLLIRFGWLRSGNPVWRWSCGALLVGGILLVHHLSLVIVVAVAAAYLVVRMIEYKKLDRLTLFLLGSGLLMLVLLNYYLYGYLLKALTLGQNETLRLADNMIWPRELPTYFGVWATIGGLAGLLAVLWGWRRWRSVEVEGEHGNERLVFVLVWLFALLGGFVGLDYGYRFIVAQGIYNDNFTALVPSRWLMVTACPLSVLAGYGFYFIWQWLRRLTPSGGPLVLRYLLLFGVAVGLAWSIPKDIRRLLSLNHPEMNWLATVGKSVMAQTPPNALIILSREVPAQPCFSYLSWRSCLADPLPASEDRRLQYEKMLLFKNLEANRGEIREWLKLHGVPCYIVMVVDGRAVMTIFE